MTGANGFVGSHLARALIRNGHRVRALVRPGADRSRVADLAIAWIEGDLDDRAALQRGCEGARWVIHCAGRVKAPDEATYQHANCTGTKNLVAAAVVSAPRLERFVYISSQAAGGPSRDGRPRTEEDAEVPLTAYGRSKLASERAVMAHADRLPVVCLRPPAVYGPADTEVLGFFRAVQWHLKPVFGGGTQRLSLVYIDDLIRGILMAGESAAAPGQVFYIADERHYTLRELEEMIQGALGNWAIGVRVPRPLLLSIAQIAEWVGRLGGFTPSLNRDKARDFLQQDWTCSTAKASRLLGYSSKVSFELGARQTVEWCRAHGWL
ncbi:MAG: NAD-dependent epimerase/dehydratase family protein [candidate division Zixibacteria bacterium]|nr:NAD-dependent epimerase/dehydratase family protein [candidate division Zixibacteria bacterium]